MIIAARCSPGGDEVTGGAETPLRSPTHEQRLRRTTSQSPYDSFAPASLPSNHESLFCE
jgi:hypothetical protein